MFYLDDAVMDSHVSIHKVGNKLNNDSLILSESLTNVSVSLIEDVKKYFLTPFESAELFNFTHASSLNLNEIYTYVDAIFKDKEELLPQSVNIATHLYNQSIHPKILPGELYVAYFTNCEIDGENVDAIGIFKSENRDTFLEIERTEKNFEIESKQGINIDKLDKGCLIFNLDRENGYVLSIVDNVNRGREAQYWFDDFLNVKVLNNDYNQTNEFLGAAKLFITKQLPQEFEMNQPDKINFLNRSVEYFKENASFDKEHFEKEVFYDDEIIDSFHQFEGNYRQERAIDYDDQFDISQQAVKKQSRGFKSVLKLDKNFHVYIHGDRELIEQGVDEQGRKFYKLYYQQES